MPPQPLHAERQPKLLNDDQVREFIANGFLRLTPDVDPSLHVEIDALVRYACEKESWYGNNIVSRIPKLHHIVRCPVVDGAIESIAGPDYYFHPHRAIHINTPVEEREELTPEINAPKMGKGSIAGSGWHQDAQSPLARARHHLPRYLIGFYFPHETPLAMGPTRIQAGSHLYAHPVAPHGVVLPDVVPAGTFLLVHFDMVHAGFPNQAERTRYMVKFVFARTRNPSGPSWNNEEADWKRPASCIPEFDLPETWSYIWHWMRGEPHEQTGDPAESVDEHLAPQEPLPSGNASCPSPSRPTTLSNFAETAKSDRLLGQLNQPDQPARLRSTYTLGKLQQIDRLAGKLEESADNDRHQRALATDERGQPVPRDDVRGFPRRWNERAIVMDDATYALAACGAKAMPTLQRLLQHEDPWVQINAAFALGEIGAPARACVAPLTELLESPHQQVVRQALDAIGAIGEGIGPALPAIERLLATTNLEWQEPQVMRGWTGENQVRMNAASALLNAINAGEHLDEIERILAGSLDDPNGYVAAIAAEALTRIGTPTAIRAALTFLSDRRWDDTLLGRVKAF